MVYHGGYKGGILRRLDLMALAKALGTEDQMGDFLGIADSHREEWRQQMRLGI